MRIDLSPEKVARLIDTVGIGFLFAPSLHPAMKHAMPVRRQLGVRTVFNILGPLTNPAHVKRQLIGVFRADLTETFCRVLEALGAERALVVHGMDGTDEVSLSSETRVSSLERGEVKTFSFKPEEAGIERKEVAAIQGASPEENAGMIRSVLEGRNGPCSDITVLNAGFVAVVAGRAPDPAAGAAMARETIRSGRAAALLDSLCLASRELAE